LESARATHQTALWNVVRFYQEKGADDPDTFDFSGEFFGSNYKKDEFNKSMLGKWLSDWGDISNLDQTSFKRVFDRKWGRSKVAH
jgi:hypothetical protein